MKTTVERSGLGTSFEREGISYFVSTVYRQEFGGYYQTMILRYPGPGIPYQPGDVAYRIEVESQQQAVTEHLDAVAMAMTKPPASWLGTKSYQDEVMNRTLSDARTQTTRNTSWTTAEIKKRIRAANIGYTESFLTRLFG